MTAINEWAIIVCSATVACALFEFLIPQGSMESIMRFTFGAFIICAIFVPMTSFKNPVFNLESKHTDDNRIYQFSNEVDKQSKEIAARSVEELVVEALREIDVYPKKIDVFMDTEDKTCISINKIKINLQKHNMDRKEEVKKLISEKLGIKTEVIV